MKISRRKGLATAALALAASGVCAASAGANTIAYTDSLTADGIVRGSSSGGAAHDCATPEAFDSLGPATFPVRLYAFRNTSGSDACVTVHGTQLTHTIWSENYVGGFDLDNPGVDFVSDSFDGVTFPVPAGATFFSTVEPLVQPSELPTPYTMSWTSDSIEALDAVAANTNIDAQNLLRVVSYGSPAGSPSGTLLVASPSGPSYSGDVRCLRVAGRNASMVVPFSTASGQSRTARGAVWWLHEGIGGSDRSGFRTKVLNQKQLDTTYATCPDPALPPGGSFRATQNGTGITVTGP